MRGKYFILTQQEGNPIPRVVNWFGKLDVRKLTRAEHKNLPPFFLLDMKVETDLFYPDVLLDPVLMVSREAMGVIRMYDKRIPFKFIALIDPEKEESASYYCPVLADGDQSSREILFRMDMGKKEVVVIHEELAESLLWRGAVGMHLEEL